MLPQIGREPKHNLSIGEIAVRPAKLAHGYTRKRVLEVSHEKLPQRVAESERLAAPLLMIQAVEHLFGVACSRQGDPRAHNGHNVADGIPPSALELGAPGPAVGTVERDGLFRHVCVCVDLPLSAAVSQGMPGVSAARSNSRKNMCPAFKKPSYS